MSFMEVDSGLGRRLKQLRQQAELTQEQLAQQLYVTRQTVSGWERGRNEPDMKTLLLLARFFGTTTDALLAPGGGNKVYVHYRRGGVVMLPFVGLALLVAALAGAPAPALLAIAIPGFATSLVLVALGKRETKR